MGGVGRSGKKSTALRYHRNRKNRREMALKQQTTAQPKAHRQLRSPTAGPVNVSKPQEPGAPYNPQKPMENPLKPSLDQDLGAQVFKVTRF